MKIVIDLGGTNLRVGQVEDGSVIKYKSVACPAKEDDVSVIQLIEELIQEMMNPQTDSINIGVPSIVDAEHGIVYNAVNIPSWKEVHLKEIFENTFHISVNVENDANCFTLGEKYFGVGKKFENMIGMTLGTGVGAGIIADGKLYRGSNACAGEIGSLPYLQSDYEHYCSSMFFEQMGLSGKDLADKASEGDIKALDLWSNFGYHLGKLMQAIMFAYDPQAIIIGGGIAKASPFFEKSMRNSMAEGFPYRHVVERIVIDFSILANSNLLGASKL